ncbi:MAG TPA: biotin synthase [Aquabacterium sp.]|nr:biotin synthase [Aquabacterium sp.]
MTESNPATLPPMAPAPAAMARQLSRLSRLSEPSWLHGEVARRLGEKLQAILLEPQDWLDWGGWLGAGQAVVQARYPQARRWVWEPTPALADRSVQQWTQQHARPWWARWQSARPPVVEHLTPPPPHWPAEGMGLVWANMALHASTDLDALFKTWHEILKVDGFLMCSGLGPDTAKELRAVYQAMGWGLPTIDFIDMHDLGDAFVQAGFADPVMDMERLSLTWPDAETMLSEWRTWGGNVATGRFAGCRTPRWRQQLIQALETHLKRPDGRLGLSLELVYGHAVKPAPRFSVTGETRVSLDDMRRMIRKS